MATQPLPCKLANNGLPPPLGALVCLLALILALLTQTRDAHAQDRPEAKDVVVLSDGSFVRGTLMEHAPGQHSVLLTRGGQLRRFEASAIRYAGPSNAMPQGAGTMAPAAPSNQVESGPAAASPQGTPSAVAPSLNAAGEWAEVRFEASRTLEIFQRTGVSTSLRGTTTGEAYAPLCTTPCATLLRPGTYTLAVAPPGNPALKAGALPLRDGSLINALYRSRRGVRIGGVLLGIAGTAAGLGMMLTDDVGDDSDGRFWGGLALSSLSTLVGLLMSRVPDMAQVRAVQ